MKERPIIFSTEMVKAILDNRKTQTRRVIKPQPDYSILKNGVTLEPHKCPVLGPVHLGHREWGLYGSPYKPTDVSCFAYNCPYGKVGDRLWVRETWANLPELSPEKTIVYKATDWKGWLEYETETIKWKPSIHMFRRDSRIDLEITDTRVERVQDISRDDCIAEGVPQTYGEFKGLAPEWTSKDKNDASYFYDNRTSRENFYLLWDSINAKRGYGWKTNPYVWCITFKRVEK